MARIVAVASLGVLLTATALAWKSSEQRIDVNAGADPPSLSISDMMLKVDAESLPTQEVADRTMVFLGAHNQ